MSTSSLSLTCIPNTCWQKFRASTKPWKAEAGLFVWWRWALYSSTASEVNGRTSSCTIWEHSYLRVHQVMKAARTRLSVWSFMTDSNKSLPQLNEIENLSGHIQLEVCKWSHKIFDWVRHTRHEYPRKTSAHLCVHDHRTLCGWPNVLWMLIGANEGRHAFVTEASICS